MLVAQRGAAKRRSRGGVVGTGQSTAQERALDDFVRHWSSHDLDSLVSLFTDDVVYEDVALGVVNHGKNEFRTFAEEFFAGFPDVTFEVTSRFATERKGCGQWTMRGTHRGDMPGMPATNKQIDIRGVSIVEFADTKIRRCVDYWDMATFLKQLGFMPAD
ncbi:MAG: ester cyclase [Chloroflexi bacterium]|nr:ester cyclase [Chloroflexota bacterium]